MAEDRVHHVTVLQARDYEFVATFDDVPNAEPLLFDEPEPLGRNRAPNAAAVLSAAVGDCLATSLAFCLKKSRIDLHGLTAQVTTHVTRNATGRFRITGIDVALAPEVGERDRECQVQIAGKLLRGRYAVVRERTRARQNGCTDRGASRSGTRRCEVVREHGRDIRPEVPDREGLEHGVERLRRAEIQHRQRRVVRRVHAPADDHLVDRGGKRHRIRR